MIRRGLSLLDEAIGPPGIPTLSYNLHSSNRRKNIVSDSGLQRKQRRRCFPYTLMNEQTILVEDIYTF